jgi:UDP-N-acetylmuramate--alanine ligase
MTDVTATGKRAHFVGIGGIGAGSLAVVLHQAGWAVSGSEPAATTLAQEVLDTYPEIAVYREFDAAHLDDVDWLIYSVAFRPDNVEIAEAHRRGIRTSTYPEALAQILADPATTAGAGTCAVAGTHGKTTTTAMVAACFEAAALPVSYLIGAPQQGGRKNVAFCPGAPFVVEADEYRAAFLNYASTIRTLVITNVDFDHPDFYTSQAEVEQVFHDLLGKAGAVEPIFACGDSGGVQELRRVHGDRIATYGVGVDNDYRITLTEANESGSVFMVAGPILEPLTVRLALPGLHNVLNATGALLAALSMGCPAPAILEALSGFTGARRRFDVLTDTPAGVVVDDYAHHPAAISALLQGVRQRYPEHHLALVMQPHTISRTVAMLDDFAACADEADQVAVMTVYAGREADGSDQPVVLATRMRELMRQRGVNVLDTEDPASIVTALADLAAGQRVVVATVGAGDVWSTVAEPLVEAFVQMP